MILSTGKFASLANGNGVCTTGDTSVLATAVESKETNSDPNVDNVLLVNYRLKHAAAGRIPSNLQRRESLTSPPEMTVSRLIDRSIRPLFPRNYNHTTQIACNTLAMDMENSPEVLSINAASLALAVSDIPWNGPIAAVR